MKRYVLIVAGGKGLRMGGELPKQFIPVEGRPILMHTLDAFHRWDTSAGLILVLPEDHQPYWRMLCREIGCKVPHQVVNGGDTRFHTVQNGLRFLSEEMGHSSDGNLEALVAVHDGVRPFVTPELISSCFDGAAQNGAIVPVIPVIDSLREMEGAGSFPVDRSRFRAVQTPQVFTYTLLSEAYKQPYSLLFTDDASVVESMGGTISTVPGDPMNIKITTPFDLIVAKTLFSELLNKRL